MCRRRLNSQSFKGRNNGRSSIEDFQIEDNATLNSIATSLGGQISNALASGIQQIYLMDSLQGISVDWH